MDKVYNYDDQKPDDDDIDKDDDNTLGRNRNLHLSLSSSTLENSSTFAHLAWCFKNYCHQFTSVILILMSTEEYLLKGFHIGFFFLLARD